MQGEMAQIDGAGQQDTDNQNAEALQAALAQRQVTLQGQPQGGSDVPIHQNSDPVSDESEILRSCQPLTEKRRVPCSSRERQSLAPSTSRANRWPWCPLAGRHQCASQRDQQSTGLATLASRQTGTGYRTWETTRACRGTACLGSPPMSRSKPARRPRVLRKPVGFRPSPEGQCFEQGPPSPARRLGFQVRGSGSLLSPRRK